MTKKREMAQKHRPEAQSYNYSVATDEIEGINRQLHFLKDIVNNHSVRCHMLEVDLATLLGPDVQAVLRATRQSCSKCTDTLQTHDNDQHSAMIGDPGQLHSTDQ